MTCKARSPQVLHPYRGDESLPVMVMIISVPKIWFLVSVQSERFSRDGNHRYNPLGFQAMVDPMDCPCSACLRQHSPKQHGWQGSLMETMTSFFTDLKSKFWHSKLKEKRNDERTISTMIIDPNYIIYYIYINYISLTIGNSLHLSQQQWSPDAQVSILSPDTWLILWKTINLHSFVHITTFESLCGYITPHPALQKSSKTSSPLFQCWMSGILSHNDAIQTQNENRARGPVSFAARGQQETSILGAPANAPSQESQKQYNQWQPVC